MAKDPNPLDFAKFDGFIAPTEHGAGLPCYTSQVSDAFCQQTERHLELIPSPIRSLLADNGVKIALVKDASHLGYTSEPKPGDTLNRSLLHIPAFYNIGYKTVVLCEQFLNQTDNKWEPAKQRAAHDVCHETGHALDYLLNIYHAAQPAYIIDKDLLNYYDNAQEFRDYYAYFLTSRGVNEVIAEESVLAWSTLPREQIAVDERDWRYMTAFSQACLNYVATHYNPDKGLCDAFKDAVHDHGRKALLSELLKRRQTVREIAQNYIDKPTSLCKEQKITPRHIRQAFDRSVAIRSVIYSLGEKEVRSVLKATEPSP